MDDNPDTAKLVESFLNRIETASFRVVSKPDGPSAFQEVESNKNIDVIIMDYFLPGMNGLEVTKRLRGKNKHIPIVFLTVKKDMNLAVEALRLGVSDYLIKEDITSPLFPKAIQSVVEKQILHREVTERDIRKRRLEAMQEFVVSITNEITAPLVEMRVAVSHMLERDQSDKAAKYLSLIKENLDRLETKMEKLKNLKEDKTVQYIRDIKMIDLS